MSQGLGLQPARPVRKAISARSGAVRLPFVRNISTVLRAPELARGAQMAQKMTTLAWLRQRSASHVPWAFTARMEARSSRDAQQAISAKLGTPHPLPLIALLLFCLTTRTGLVRRGITVPTLLTPTPTPNNAPLIRSGTPRVPPPPQIARTAPLATSVQSGLTKLLSVRGATTVWPRQPSPRPVPTIVSGHQKASLLPLSA